MLLTRAPLNKSRIATQPAPCDLHVLNTPPAFVLSQNQTLRKKFGWRLFPKEKRISKLTLMDFSIVPRAFSARSAQFNLFPLPSIPRADRPADRRFHLSSGTSRAGPHCQRSCIEETKKPIGWLASLPHLDRRSVSRPPSVVAAREAIHPHPHSSTHFLTFFLLFFDDPAAASGGRGWMPRTGAMPRIASRRVLR